jgi:SpoVK/Ycf46/Vps4 family AAA+-type ATPase
VFSFASGGNYVIMFDEFDAIASSRNGGRDAQEMNRVVNALLQQLDSFNSRSLIISATNLERQLDFAVWRRFD